MKNLTLNNISENSNNSNLLKVCEIAKKVIKENFKIKNRIEAFNQLCSQAGVNSYTSQEPMGSGGVGQIKEMKDCFRIQLSHGWGRYNYAIVAVVEK